RRPGWATASWGTGWSCMASPWTGSRAR
ncbi:MAG: Manganese uptake regulation protein MUR, partial [uncultured Rubellimicrobium sp.]